MHISADRIKERIGLYKFALAFVLAIFSSCFGFFISRNESLILTILSFIISLITVLISAVLWKLINNLIEKL